MANSVSNLSIEQLKQAVRIKEQIAQLERDLNSVLGSKNATAAPGKRSGMSPAARERIAAAQRARWAKVKGTSAGAKSSAIKSEVSKPGPRKMSPAARAKIAAAARARWARVKAAK
jgi:hypothetical protein